MHLVTDDGSTFNTMLNPCRLPLIQERIQREVKQLCQNCIVFGVQLTIQGLLGITVDGSEVFLVNIQEQVDKTSDGENSTTSNAVDMRTVMAGIRTSPIDMRKKKNKAQRRKSDYSVTLVEIKDEPTGDSVEIEGEETSMPEVMELIEDPVKDTIDTLLNDFGDNCEAGDENYPAENEEQEYDESTTTAEAFVTNDQLYQLAVNAGNELQRIAPSSSTTNFVRSIAKRKRITAGFHNAVSGQWLGGGLAANNSAYGASGSVYVDQNDYTSSLNYTAVDSDSSRRTSLALSTTSHQIFKCSTCGQVMRHLSSFLRHKKQHQGAVYRCDICGKVMNRRDNLVSHKRRYCNGTNVGGVTIAHEEYALAQCNTPNNIAHE